MNFGIRIHAPGGPGVLKYEEIADPVPAAGEVLIRHTAIGLNFIDVYHRTGLYPVPTPFTPGMEAAGIIEAVGQDVQGLNKGDRVAYATGPLGAYVQYRVMPATRVVKIPDGVSDEQAATILKGMTAEYLLHRTYKVQKGDTILFHAAAGGVGLIACQWAKHMGATVIGTVGSEEKVALVKENGCDHVILYNKESVPARVREITNGKGVPVVYDSVGATTFMDSLDCLQKRGMMVSFGNASGPVPPFAPSLLSAKGSLFFTRPSMTHYTDDDAEYQSSAKAVLDVIEKGVVKIAIKQRYALKDAAQAHEDLEARKTTGSSIFYI